MSTTYKALHNGNQENHTVTSVFRDSDHPNETAADLFARHTAKVQADMNGDWPLYQP